MAVLRASSARIVRIVYHLSTRTLDDRPGLQPTLDCGRPEIKLVGEPIMRIMLWRENVTFKDSGPRGIGRGGIGVPSATHCKCIVEQ